MESKCEGTKRCEQKETFDHAIDAVLAGAKLLAAYVDQYNGSSLAEEPDGLDAALAGHVRARQAQQCLKLAHKLWVESRPIENPWPSLAGLAGVARQASQSASSDTKPVSCGCGSRPKPQPEG